MGIMKSIGEILSPNDPELVQKTLKRLESQDRWNDVFSTVLFEMRDGSDSLKEEIREQLRVVQDRLEQSESVTQTETALKSKLESFGSGIERLDRTLAIEQRSIAQANIAAERLDSATRVFQESRVLTETARTSFEQANISLAQARQTLETSAKTADLAGSLAQGARIKADEAESRLNSAQRLYQRVCIAAIVGGSTCSVSAIWMWCFILRSPVALSTGALLSTAIAATAGLLIRRVLREA